MTGIVGIIALLTVLGLSLVITRIATTALNLTGLSWDAAKFQARSAFTGTGFTTEEAESVVSHPVRRKIITWLMIARSAGLLSIVISLILSFAGAEESGGSSRLMRLLWLIGGVGVLWVIASSKYVEGWMRRWIEKALNRWTDLEVRDYDELLRLSGEYTFREVFVEEDDWLAGQTLGQCSLRDEGVLVIGIIRSTGDYVGAPGAGACLYEGDTLVMYGRAGVLQNLDERRSGAEGEAAHEEAKSAQMEEEARQAKDQRDFEKKTGRQDPP